MKVRHFVVRFQAQIETAEGEIRLIEASRTLHPGVLQCYGKRLLKETISELHTKMNCNLGVIENIEKVTEE